MSFSDRHSFQDRPKRDTSHDAVHQSSPHHHGVHLKRDEAEDLANKIMEVGSEYEAKKASARYSEEDVPSGPMATIGGPDPEHLANKIIKESAREMMRAEGNVHSGSLASMAERVSHFRNDPKARPEHLVKEKIIERIATAEEHFERHDTFQGPNPDEGHEKPNTKLRHMRGAGAKDPYVTAGLRQDKNPDVLP